MRLDEWMKIKWQGKRPESYDFRRYIKSVKVYCHVGNKEHRLIRTIWDIGPDDIAHTRFVKDRTGNEGSEKGSPKQVTPKKGKGVSRKSPKSSNEQDEGQTVYDYMMQSRFGPQVSDYKANVLYRV
jgi:hypothetical protein